ncbi:MAG: glycosyltransferase family 4 protein [Desulfobacterales bacterium]
MNSDSRSVKKIKLALIHPQYRPDGGAERSFMNTLGALGRDVHITIISRSVWQTEKGVSFIKCNPFYVGRLWKKWGFARAAEKILKNVSVDIVQSWIRLPGCDIYRAGGGVYSQFLKQRRRISSFPRRVANDLSPYHNNKLVREKKMYQHPNLKAVICNSEMVKKELLETYDVGADKIHVIYNAVDLEFFHPSAADEFRSGTRTRLGISEKDTVFLFVGSGFERKGLGQLIPAFAELPTDCHLVAVGKESNERYYKRLAKSCGLSQRVHFTGMQSDVRPFYAAADAFVLPTLYDAFANTVLEAMACGLPVLTGEKCGAIDIIENGKNGFICDPIDKETLAEYLNSLRSPELRKSMGPAGRNTVEKMNMGRMRSELMSLYSRVLEETG